MANTTPPRISGLHRHYQIGRSGAHQAQPPGIVLQEINALSLWQIAAWPDSFAQLAPRIAQDYGISAAPKPGKSASGNSASGKSAAVLRIEPLKFWILAPQITPLAPELGCVIDQSHSRTCIRLSGARAVVLLNRHLPLDLRAARFPADSVASTAFHHIGITLWHHADGYDLFMPRGFALSLWGLLEHSALQFGLEILPARQQ